jgi:hypothetical protein
MGVTESPVLAHSGRSGMVSYTDLTGRFLLKTVIREPLIVRRNV